MRPVNHMKRLDPVKCSFAYLLDTVKEDLQIDYDANTLRLVTRSNYDLTGCCPVDISPYRRMALLSKDPEEVLRAAVARAAYPPELNPEPSKPPPQLRSDDAVSRVRKYVNDVTVYGLEMMKERERRYAAYFEQLCLCHAKHLILEAESRDSALAEIKRVYYRDIKNLAYWVFFEMFRRACYDVYAAIYQNQKAHQIALEEVTFVWKEKHATSYLFQPLLFYPGAALLLNERGIEQRINPMRVRNLNVIRRALGLPVMVIPAYGEAVSGEGFTPADVTERNSQKGNPSVDLLDGFVRQRLNAYTDSKENGKKSQGSDGEESLPLALPVTVVETSCRRKHKKKHSTSSSSSSTSSSASSPGTDEMETKARIGKRDKNETARLPVPSPSTSYSTSGTSSDSTSSLTDDSIPKPCREKGMPENGRSAVSQKQKNRKRNCKRKSSCSSSSVGEREKEEEKSQKAERKKRKPKKTHRHRFAKDGNPSRSEESHCSRHLEADNLEALLNTM